MFNTKHPYTKINHGSIVVTMFFLFVFFGGGGGGGGIDYHLYNHNFTTNTHRKIRL